MNILKSVCCLAEECETQTYFVQSKCDSTEKTIAKSDDDSGIN